MILINLSDLSDRWQKSKTAILKTVKQGHLKPFRQFRGGYYVFDLRHIMDFEFSRGIQIKNKNKISEIIDKIFCEKS